MSKTITKSLTVRLGDDAEEINNNFIQLSRSLGRKINKTDLLKYILKNCNSKHSLYSLGFISYQELHEQPTFKRGGKNIKLSNRRMKHGN